MRSGASWAQRARSASVGTACRSFGQSPWDEARNAHTTAASAWLLSAAGGKVTERIGGSIPSNEATGSGLRRSSICVACCLSKVSNSITKSFGCKDKARTPGTLRATSRAQLRAAADECVLSDRNFSTIVARSSAIGSTLGHVSGSSSCGICTDDVDGTKAKSFSRTARRSGPSCVVSNTSESLESKDRAERQSFLNLGIACRLNRLSSSTSAKSGPATLNKSCVSV
mmetsp:Transcript_4998/g.7519  ORF Transcript_4998/g.7519 Transcript_4998/m.7519 type:complete len:227 (+) Transcript_4998:671-1351(+)